MAYTCKRQKASLFEQYDQTGQHENVAQLCTDSEALVVDHKVGMTVTSRVTHDSDKEALACISTGVRRDPLALVWSAVHVPRLIFSSSSPHFAGLGWGAGATYVACTIFL